MRFRNLTAENVGEIKSFLALLMQEQYEDGAFVARITNITRSNYDYRIKFERDTSVDILTPEEIDDLTIELGIDNFEFHRTHWAVKRADLRKLLSSRIVEPNPESEIEFAAENIPPKAGEEFNRNQVFIVRDAGYNI